MLTNHRWSYDGGVCLYKSCLLATPVCVLLFPVSLHSQLFTPNHNFHFSSFISPFCSFFSFAASFPCDIHSHLPNHRISASSSRQHQHQQKCISSLSSFPPSSPSAPVLSRPRNPPQPTPLSSLTCRPRLTSRRVMSPA